MARCKSNNNNKKREEKKKVWVSKSRKILDYPKKEEQKS